MFALCFDDSSIMMNCSGCSGSSTENKIKQIENQKKTNQGLKEHVFNKCQITMFFYNFFHFEKMTKICWVYVVCTGWTVNNVLVDMYPFVILVDIYVPF